MQLKVRKVTTFFLNKQTKNDKKRKFLDFVK